VRCDAYSAPSSSALPYWYEGDDDGGGRGLCTVLRVSFGGWGEERVRKVIGESWVGWCELLEVGEEDASASTSTTTSLSSSVSASVCQDDESDFGSEVEVGMGTSMEIDPASSFVLPTLDFSSSFLASPPAPMPIFSPRRTYSDTSTVDLSTSESSWGYPSLSSSSSSASPSESDSDTDAFSDTSLSDFGSDLDLDSLHSSWAHIQPQPSSSSGGFGFGFSSAFVGRLNSAAAAGGEEPRVDMF
jgi:hypothetical protein